MNYSIKEIFFEAVKVELKKFKMHLKKIFENLTTEYKMKFILKVQEILITKFRAHKIRHRF